MPELCGRFGFNFIRCFQGKPAQGVEVAVFSSSSVPNVAFLSTEYKSQRCTLLFPTAVVYGSRGKYQPITGAALPTWMISAVNNRVPSLSRTTKGGLPSPHVGVVTFSPWKGFDVKAIGLATPVIRWYNAASRRRGRHLTPRAYLSKDQCRQKICYSVPHVSHPKTPFLVSTPIPNLHATSATHRGVWGFST